MFGLINRGNLPGPVQSEFENLIARLQQFLLKEHNEDGTHLTSIATINFVPVGLMADWPTNTPPQGWVICQGQQLSRLTYKGLFDVIGTTYGVGDGSTTFNVPDCRGRFTLHKAAAGTGNTIAGTGGALDHTHSGGTTSSDGSHSHTGSTGSESSHTHRMSEHRHAISSVDSSTPGGGGAERAGVTQFDIFDSGSGTEVPTGAGTSHLHTISSDGSHTHTAPTTGSSNPAYLVLNSIIFTGVSS